MFDTLDFSWLADPTTLRQLGEGSLTTVEISVLGIVAMAVFGVVGAAIIQFRVPFLYTVTRICVDLLRNTPSLVQIFFLFFLLPDLRVTTTDRLGREIPLLDGFACTVLALGLFNGAMAVEIIRSGIAAVPAATVEGARSLGYTSRQIFWRIELPLALRFTAPAMTNNIVSLVKNTSQASLIAVADVMYYAQQVIAINFRNLEVMIVVWIIYLVLASIFAALAHLVARLFRIPGYGISA